MTISSEEGVELCRLVHYLFIEAGGLRAMFLLPGKQEGADESGNVVMTMTIP